MLGSLCTDFAEPIVAYTNANFHRASWWSLIELLRPPRVLHLKDHVKNHGLPLRWHSIQAMNTFPAGTRVFFWGALSAVVYGTVQSTDRLPDGTQIVRIQDDDGKAFTLPAASVTKVT